ncbi:MAG: glycosyltransferase family 39 protein [Acidobacteria bacterium]|nr:glycosyltransferase family 39 protein [Acidobacteriota bacterium]
MDTETRASRPAYWLHGLFLIVITFLFSFHYRLSLPAFDEGLYYQEAQRMLHGEVIYRDFFEFVTPGTFFFIKWIFEIFGEHIVAVRYGLFVLYLLETWLIFWLGIRLLRRPSLAYLPALLFVYLAKYDAWWSVQHHVLSHFTAVATAYFLVRSLDEDKLWLGFCSGLSVGCALCITQHLGVLLFVAATPWVCYIGPRFLKRSRRQPTTAFLLGVALPVAMLGVYLIANGAMAAAYDCCVNWVFGNYKGYEGTAPYYDEGRKLIVRASRNLSGLAALRSIVQLVLIGYVSVLAMLIGLARLVYGLFWRRLEGPEIRDLLAYGVVWSISAALVGHLFPHANYYWAVRQNVTLTFIFVAELLSAWKPYVLPTIRFWFDRARAEDGRNVLNLHLGFLTAKRTERSLMSRVRLHPPLDGSTGEGRALTLDLSGLRLTHIMRRVFQPLCLVVLVWLYWDIGTGLFADRQRALQNRSLRVYIDTPVGRLWTLNAALGDDIKQICEFVKTASRPGDPIFVLYHTPYLYSFVQRPNATRYAIFWPGYHSPLQIDEVVRALSEHKAALVIKDQTVELNLRREDLRLLRYGAENLPREPLLVAVQQFYTPVLQTKHFAVLAPLQPPTP